jgi:hypothetical protein
MLSSLVAVTKMSDNEEAYDDTGMSDTSEPELDEHDQNDDADAEPDDDDNEFGDDMDEDDMIYGPLRTLKIRDGDHIHIQIVPDEQRKTSNIMSLPEFAEATGIRASQIERGAHVFTDVAGLRDPRKMAHKEFRDRRSPLLLERKIETRGNIHIVEHWRVREMTYIHNETDD